jgi:hypothetical protein
VYLQGDYHLVSPCHYLDVRIKQKGSSGPRSNKVVTESRKGSKRPQRSLHPQPHVLPRRNERRAARIEKPDGPHGPQPRRLPQHDGRGAARTDKVVTES